MISKKQTGSSIVTEIMLVTPKLAKKWLEETNTNNRRIASMKVMAMAAAIERGEWHLTHQGIAFYEDDSLADGQHRLSAIVKADKPVRCMVTYGLPKQAHAGIDEGKIGRNLQDRMTFLGRNLQRLELAIYRNLWSELRRQKLGLECWDEHHPQSDLEAFAAMQSQYAEAVQFVMSVPVPANKVRHGCLFASVAAAYFTEDHDRLKEFLQVVASGIARDEADSAAIRVRDYFMTSTLSRSTPARFDAYCKCCAGVSSFVRHRGLSKLYAARTLLFALPSLS